MKKLKYLSMDGALLVALSLLFGGSFILNEVVLKDLPVLIIVWSRVGIAALALIIFMKALGISFQTDLREVRELFILGLLNNIIPFLFIVFGQKEATGGLAAIMIATTPLFTVIIAHYYTVDEKMDINKVFGILVGVIGVFFVVLPENGEKVTFASSSILFFLVAACSYALASVFGKRFSKRGANPIFIATGQITCSFILLTPISLYMLSDISFSNIHIETWVALLILSIFCTAVAFIIYFHLLSTIGASNLQLVTLIIPFSAIALGFLFLDEIMEWNHIIGMIIICFGLYAMNKKLISSYFEVGFFTSIRLDKRG